MRTTTIMLLAALAAAPALVAAPAHADPGLWQWSDINMRDMQKMAAPALASHVGDWVYAPDGSIIGSLDSIKGTSHAVIRVSEFFKSGDHLLSVPIADLVLADSKLVVHNTDFAKLTK